ncbi:hypothetical protein MMC18_002810 [Xylographa bjoerkii]|nr:hypothetical protein [Xylographa bjoerkii]
MPNTDVDDLSVVLPPYESLDPEWSTETKTLMRTIIKSSVPSPPARCLALGRSTEIEPTMIAKADSSAASPLANNLALEPSTETEPTMGREAAASPLLNLSLELHNMILANLSGLEDLRAFAFTCQYFSVVCLAIRQPVLQKLFLRSSTISAWYLAILIKARQSGDWTFVHAGDFNDIGMSVISLTTHCHLEGCTGIFTLGFEDLVAVRRLSQIAARTALSLESSGLASPLLVYALLMDECNPYGPDNASHKYQRPPPRRWIDSVIRPDLLLHKKGRAFAEVLLLFSHKAAKVRKNGVWVKHD